MKYHNLWKCGNKHVWTWANPCKADINFLWYQQKSMFHMDDNKLKTTVYTCD